MANFKGNVTCIEDSKLDTLLSHLGRSEGEEATDEQNNEDELEEEVNIYYKMAVFISDRNKGIANALKTHLPGNHSCNCAWHIR